LAKEETTRQSLEHREARQKFTPKDQNRIDQVIQILSAVGIIDYQIDSTASQLPLIQSLFIYP